MLDDDAVFKESTVMTMFADVRRTTLPNGLRMEYAVHGCTDTAEKVLFIHGLLCEKESWTPLLATLLDPMASYGKYHYVTFDNRGVGGTDKPLERYTTSQMAQDVLMLLDHLQWPKAHILGVSMGGMIAQELAHAAPDRVSSLTLVTTTPGHTSGAFPGIAQFGTYLGFARFAFATGKADVVEHMMTTLYTPAYLDTVRKDGRTNRELLRDYHLARVAKIELSVTGGHAQHAAVFGHNMSPARLSDVQKAGFPILIVGASGDKILHPANADLLHKYLDGPRTRKVVFESGGHCVQNQLRNELADVLHDNFLAVAP
ncbi:serine protease family S33 [Achlya hypogyna]|uniref:Serine protease family S33 n=1 Tax=Achlya hypogyna TaxID=1202772 RepID=A0A1V9YPH1_ACHHY|nr:serine protease family S33 [Achlya hypogyna]